MANTLNLKEKAQLVEQFEKESGLPFNLARAALEKANYDKAKALSLAKEALAKSNNNATHATTILTALDGKTAAAVAAAAARTMGKGLTTQEVEAMKSRLLAEEETLVFNLQGAVGRSIKIYPNKVVIGVAPTIGAAITGNGMDGEKTIYFTDCVGLQYKRPGATVGYLQFETASGLMNQSNSNFFNENTFTFNNKTVDPKTMQLVVMYVKDRLNTIKQK